MAEVALTFECHDLLVAVGRDDERRVAQGDLERLGGSPGWNGAVLL